MYNYTISVVNLKPKETINLKSNNSIMIINSTLNVLSVRLLNSNPLINPKTKEKINFTDDKIMSNAIEWGMKKLKTREFKTDNLHPTGLRMHTTYVNRKSDKKKKSETELRIRRLDESTYTKSLVYTNRLIMKEFGAKNNRKVPPHMPHMINKEVMKKLEKHWEKEFNITSSHKFRSNNDIQYSYGYYTYLMEKINDKSQINLHQIFKTFWDTNNDGYIDENELLTVFNMISDGDFTNREVKEKMIDTYNCISHLNNTFDEMNENFESISTNKITFEDLRSCNDVIDGLKKNYKDPSNQYEVLNDNDVGFEMITDDLNETVKQLNSLRKRQSKFICINDDISNFTITIKQLILDFYNSFHPICSPLELCGRNVNEYLRVEEYKKYVEEKENMKILTLVVIFIVIIVVMIISRSSMKKLYDKCLINRSKEKLKLEKEKDHNN